MKRRFSADRVGESVTRRLAGHTSRRSLLNKVGLALVAAPIFPLLPVSRAFASKPERAEESATHFARSAQTKDATKCTSCGGGVHTCPAGSEPSPVSWVGTCINPDDNKAYLIAYRDCCGKAGCGQCGCDNDDRETQIYQPQTNNNVIWCFGVSNTEYHCSTAALVGAVA